MRENRNTALELIFDHEGGYVDHPRDPGGCTHRGITLATYRDRINPRATCDDLRRMDKATAGQIYIAGYWHAVRADELPGGLDAMVFDHAVNAGPSRSIRLLQDVVGTAPDGRFGPITLAAVQRIDVAAALDLYAERRLTYYRGLTHWGTFGPGWTARVTETLAISRWMAQQAAASPTLPPAWRAWTLRLNGEPIGRLTLDAGARLTLEPEPSA